MTLIHYQIPKQNYLVNGQFNMKSNLDFFLKNYIQKKACTLLGIGPMSKNCVDASIELANEKNIPIMLIASRRQIDSEDFGGGYVNNWSTSEFSKYVRMKDKKKLIYLARDHGGPWQSNVECEQNMDLSQAMKSCKLSYQNDINSGFDILHIDPSIDIHTNPKIDDILDRAYELYEFCSEYALKKNKEIIFEVGTEEQSESTESLEVLEYKLENLFSFCKKNKFIKPTFIVMQTGTKVMETKNIGSFDSPLRILDEMPTEIQIPRLTKLCQKFSILMKAHNVDYLQSESLKWFPRLGIHSANIAPEFGVIETKAFCEILKKFNLMKDLEKFYELSFLSGKWKKWMLDESNATDIDKAIIAGHYVFSSVEFLKLKTEVIKKIKKKNFDLDFYLKNSVKKSIDLYIQCFNLC